MTKKKFFRLPGDKIRPLATGFGACIATDMITVEGEPIGHMYREEPDDAVDSGWRFLSGLEDQSYVDDPANSAIYDVNTIANYDPSIIPYLRAPVGSAFDRIPGTDAFLEVEFDGSEPPDEILQ